MSKPYPEEKQIEFREACAQAILLAAAGQIDEAEDIILALPKPVQEQILELIERSKEVK